MRALIESPLFCLVLCLIAFQIGLLIQSYLKWPILNPLLLAMIGVIVMLECLEIPLDTFKEGTRILSMLLGPATVVLAIPMYKQRELLRTYFPAIFIATGVGALTAILSVVGLSHLFGLDESLIVSLIPKSVTTPIALQISEQLGGIAGITVTAVVIAGMVGAVIAPNLLKLFKIKHAIAVGLAIGTSSHALGTSKAIQLGEVQGAMSGLAIGFTGLFTMILSLFI